MKVFWALLITLAGCSPSSPEDFLHEGEALAQEFIEELKEIETKNDLEKKAYRLQKKYAKLMRLIDQVTPLKEDPSFLSQEKTTLSQEELKKELMRIYLLPGGREIMERIQNDANAE